MRRVSGGAAYMARGQGVRTDCFIRIVFATALIAAIPGMTGCGGTIYTRQETGKFASAGSKVVAEASAFYSIAVQSDNEFYATVVATSPSCPVPDLLANTDKWRFPPAKLYGAMGIAEIYAQAGVDIAAETTCGSYLARLDKLRGKNQESWAALEARYREQLAPLCMASDEIRCVQALPPDRQRMGFVEISPSPIGIERFSVELQTLKGVAEYLDALGNLAKDPDSRVDVNLKNAIEKLEETQKYFEVELITKEIKEKQEAVGGLLNTLRNLYLSSKQAREIKQTLNEKSDDIASSLEKLAVLSDRTYQEIFVASVDLRVTRAKNYLEMSTEGQSLADRQIAMSQYMKDAKLWRAAQNLKTTENGIEHFNSPTGTALRGVVDAQENLIRAINTPNKEQKAEIAALSLKNFRNVLKGLYGVLGAFGVM